MHGQLLQIAFEELKKIFPHTSEIFTLRDDFGRYAKEITVDGFKYFLCAKGSMLGGELSIHEELLKNAERANSKIVMYVKPTKKAEGTFYVILPMDVRRDPSTWLNERYGATMVNFHIKHAQNLFDILKVKRLLAERQAQAEPTLF